jgi:hypothetical protein
LWLCHVPLLLLPLMRQLRICRSQLLLLIGALWLAQMLLLLLQQLHERLQHARLP